MAKADQKQKDATAEETFPETRSEEQSQLVPVGSMDRDPATGAEIKVGIPETSDEEDVAEFILWLQQKAEEANGDEMDMLVEELRRAKTATSVADALRGKHTVNGKDYIDKPFMCTGFRIHEGKYEDETLPYFVSLEAVNAEYPEGFILNCGGVKILVHVRTLDNFNAFPIPLAVRGKTNKRGRTPLTFEVLQQAK